MIREQSSRRHERYTVVLGYEKQTEIDVLLVESGRIFDKEEGHKRT